MNNREAYEKLDKEKFLYQYTILPFMREATAFLNRKKGPHTAP